MDKNAVVEALLDSLQAELNHAVAASQDAADYAVDEEARAESQWDTQGLEASYLAAGQASQARQWAEAIESLERSRNELLEARTEIALGAFARCEIKGAEEHFFVAPVGGGQVLSLDDATITVLTPRSPLAALMWGKQSGETFVPADGGGAKILDIQ